MYEVCSGNNLGFYSSLTINCLKILFVLIITRCQIYNSFGSFWFSMDLVGYGFINCLAWDSLWYEDTHALRPGFLPGSSQMVILIVVTLVNYY